MTIHSDPRPVAGDGDSNRVDANNSIRAPYLSDDDLGAVGAGLASADTVALPGYVAFSFQARQRDNEREILAAFRSTVAASKSGEMITPAAQWLIDNYYLVEENIREVERDLPMRFYRQLPSIAVQDGTRMPRSLAIAWTCVAHMNSAVSLAGLSALVEGFQSVETLRIGEIWAIPSILRFVLIENLRRISHRVERARRMRHRANEAADRMLAVKPGESCETLLSGMADFSRDNTFAAQLLYRLRDGSQTSKEAIGWLESRLEERGIDAEEVLVMEHNRLASGNVTIGNIIQSLRKINDIDWSVWFEDMSRVDRVLREAADFAALDFTSRDLYRKAIETLAMRSGRAEIDVAGVALSLAGSRADGTTAREQQNIGFYLVGDKRSVLEAEIGYRPRPRERVARAYSRLDWLGIALPVAVLTVAFLCLGGWLLAEAGLHAGTVGVLLLLFALPASEAASGLFHALATLVITPTRMVGYEYRDGIPESARTLVVMPCLIGSKDGIDDLVRNLEVHYLANPKGCIGFALVSDWSDSDIEESPEDREALAYARDRIDMLNTRYDDSGETRFFLFHRRRLHNPSENAWMGWERKRGKLHELNRLLRGDTDTTFLPGHGDLPPSIQYVMTLDADTRLTRDAVTKLVGKMAHPTNAPVFDEHRRRVAGGHGILQPRVTPSLTIGEEASAFQRIYSVNRGLDPYVFTVSDVYQDLLGEGSFTGKGLYHIDAFEAALEGRIEENAVLSHDLLEGSFARAGLATDVELVEDFPVRYEVEVSRQHRWARGDWQLLPYILGSANGVGMLGRWKMFDNLRRSLTPVAWLAASVLGWCVMAAGLAALWQAVLTFSLFVAPTVSLAAGALPRRTDIVARAHIHAVASEINSANAQVALRIVFIGHTAWLMADAILRALYRMFASHRNLLEWRTAAQVQSSGSRSLLDYFGAMWQAPAIAVTAFAVVVVCGGSIVLALPFTLLWALSPAAAWLVSQSAETEDRLTVPAAAKTELRKIARRTWSYFVAFVNAENNHLPPDNFQENPEPALAHRTSPTNIGVYLLSVVSARDFGWIGLAGALTRLENTISVLERMEKHRGHLFNWYDTRTLDPLDPRYVSSVDSGNLAGHLITVSSTCREWAEAPSAYLDGGIEGIDDTLAILSDRQRALADDRKTIRPLRRRLEERITGFHEAIAALRREPEFVSIRTINLTVLAREIQRMAANLDREVQSAGSRDLVGWTQALFETCEAYVADSMVEADAVEDLRERLQAMGERARGLAFRMDFGFLLRQDRRLLSIGYRVDAGELDESCYDLLASEARLTSLFGIAKGDLPTEHWFRLGRPVVPIGSRAALLSWSGSMFEYLMPPLVMQERPGGILNQSSQLIIKRQMSHARSLGIPWGISEAAFNARDHELTYQYSNFGVPSLGLKRGLGHNAVIAPYASLLASQYAPKEALANLDRLSRMGASGRYGFHDAVDFTPTRVPEGKSFVVVENYMAHHQGMSIAAVANVVFEGRLRERFHADPVIEAAELLLQEKAPREIPVLTAKREPEETTAVEAELDRPEFRTVADPASADRATVLLSNGHYSVMLTATGSGYSKWNGQAVTRWQPDPVEDKAGTFIFLRDMKSGEWWSATAEPRRRPGETTHTIFGDDKAEFHKTVDHLRSELECIVATENDGEGRRLTLFNEGDEDREIEVTSYAEAVLAAEEADAAHPAFSKMFVRTKIGPDGDVIHAERNKRTASDPDMHVVHMVTGGGLARAGQAETDRAAFIGRGRRLCEAAAFDDGASLSQTDGFTLDPIFSLRRIVRIPAGKKARIVFWTIAAPSRTEADNAVERYRYADSFRYESIHAWTRSQVQCRYVGISSQEAAGFQRLGRYLIYPDLHLGADAETVKTRLSPQSALWPLSISGDFPIFALRINDEIDMEIAAKALRAQEYLRARGLLADLVIINEKPSSYAQDMQNALEAMCENARLRGQAMGPRRHIFSVRRDLMDEATHQALLAASRIVLHARNGRLSDQLDRAGDAAIAERRVAERHDDAAPASAPDDPQGLLPARDAGGAVDLSDLRLSNGYGGFSDDGRTYVVRLHGGGTTPHPWINVLANPDFGFHVSAEGAGFTWSRNSRDYQLTPWSNDPVVNRPGEAIYVVDLDTGVSATPLATLSSDPSAVFEARHALGHSTFSTRTDDLALELTQVVDPADPIKLSRLRIANSGTGARRLRVYGYAEWVLGNNRARTAPFVVPGMDRRSEVLGASNPYSINYADRFAFLACDRPLSSFTADRRSFLGRGGSVYTPAAVAGVTDLSCDLDVGGDPCAAIATDITVAAGGSQEVVFMLGDADGIEAAAEIVERQRGGTFDDRIKAADSQWSAFTDALQVTTPDEAMNHMINAWLPYQSLSCRITARSAFYQASGAFGFRDQLQDTLALMLHDPKLARRQIIEAAGRQFEKGDVQHWWLPESGAGVRTTIADDVVWLAYGLAEYCRVTGDTALLDEEAPFLAGDELEPGQHDSFFQPSTSEAKATLYEHAARALDLAIERTGPHGLPLILGGDWNDGMNRVGAEGRGESVWLGWFLLRALADFVPLATMTNDGERADRWQGHAERLKAALEDAGWDGAYYRRGYYDDGTPLGSSQSEECRIDSIAQSWCVLSGHYDEERAGKAMDAVLTNLVDLQAELVKLFTPPFDRTDREPGYIKGYPPGVRENGGQYTHAATWVVRALAELGRGDDAYACFSMLNPITHSRDKAAADLYRVEPYALAADIYGESPRTGRGGWTWYTGSAGWLYRVAVEGILGIRREGRRLVVDPVLPGAWDGFSAVLKQDGVSYAIAVTKGRDGACAVSVNGQLLSDPKAGYDMDEQRPMDGADLRRKQIRIV